MKGTPPYVLRGLQCAVQKLLDIQNVKEEKTNQFRLQKPE